MDADVLEAIKAKMSEEELSLFEEVGAASIERPMGAAPPKQSELIKAGIEAIRRARKTAQPYICGSQTIKELVTSHRANTALDLCATIYDCLEPYQVTIFGSTSVPLVAVSVIMSRTLLIEFCFDYWFP
jgi:hypothetical protein